MYIHECVFLPKTFERIANTKIPLLNEFDGSSWPYVIFAAPYVAHISRFVGKRGVGRVARCYIFKPKIPIWVNFCNVRCWYILWPFGIFCGHLVYFMVIWYNYPCFGMLCQKNLATLGVGRLGKSLGTTRWTHCRHLLGRAAADEIGLLNSGWPDWANFRPMGYCLLWAVTWKLQK
jgi:hypothetical protein